LLEDTAVTKRTLNKNSAKLAHPQWITQSNITLPKEQTIPPGAAATFFFPIQFSNLPKGKTYFSFGLNVNGEIIDIEGADRVMRID
jgi:hypothetical protein